MSRLYPERPFLAASVAVFRDGKVLLARRTQGAGAGLFSLPGGMVETGESMAAAALRELKEETGVEARLVRFVDHVEVIIRDDDDRVKNHATIAVFAGEWIAGEGETGPEAGAILWADPFAALDVPMTRGLPQILQKAAHIVKNGGESA